MKKIPYLLSAFISCTSLVYTQPTGSYYAPTIVQDKTIFFSGDYPDYETYYGPGAVISPGDNNSPVDISNAAYVEFMGGDEVRLTDGFRAGDFSDGLQGGNAGEFKAWINKPVDVVYLAPDESQLIDGTLHVKKWEKMELAVRLPSAYQEAVETFFQRHFQYLNSAPITYAGGVINPYPGITPGPYELNPYAFDSLEVIFDFTSPSGTTYSKAGFFMREAGWGPMINNLPGSEFPSEDINSVLHDYNIHVRFSPTEETTGNQLWKVQMRLRAPFISALPAYTFFLTQFRCDPPDADKHGYLKVNPVTMRTMQFDDGTPFFGIGENLVDQRNWDDDDLMAATNGGAWEFFYRKNFEEHMQTVNELSSAGANMVRLIMCGWNYTTMCEDINAYDAYYSEINCLGAPRRHIGNHQYYQRKLDELFDLCYEKNIYIKLNPLISFPQAWNEWGNYGHNMFFKKYVTNFDNPTPQLPLEIDKFFKNPNCTIPGTTIEEVEYYWKRYFKYLMSRWGYSINLGILEPMGEVNQTIGYRELDWTLYDSNSGAYLYGNTDICENHRGIYTQTEVTKIRDAIDDWYTMVGKYIRDWSYPGGLKERYVPIAISYTDYYQNLWVETPSTGSGNWIEDWPPRIDHCRLFYHDQVDLVEIHRYRDDITAFRENALLTQSVYDPLKFNLTPPKPFACGELATPGDIDHPDFPGDATKRISTSHFYNNYDISHHNEIWGSAFTGDYHGGFTWYPYVAHRYLNATPKPKKLHINDPQPRNLGESFTFRDINGLSIDINGNNILSGYTDIIKSTYHNFKPLSDFFNTISGNGISLNNFWEDHHIYDDIQNVECYYQTEGTGDHAIGWIHNINFYWANKFYYWAKTTQPIAAYYNLNGCNPSTINQGLELDWLIPNANYTIDFYLTRMGAPPPNFPSSVIVQADVNGKVTLNASVFGTWLGCDTMTADLAFIATRLPNRSNSDQFTEIQPMDSNSISCMIYPNPSQGIFDVIVKSKDESRGILPVVSLFDMAGRMLDKRQMTGAREQFNFLFLEKGCYLVEVNYDKHMLYKKIIIQ